MIERKDCTISVDVEVDDMPLRGNVLVSGDDKVDRIAEDEVKVRLNQGDVWAWADVTVSVAWSLPGSCHDIIATQHLGCCSYADEAAFRKNAYFSDMVDECIAELEGMIDQQLANAEALLKKDKCLNCEMYKAKVQILQDARITTIFTFNADYTNLNNIVAMLDQDIGLLEDTDHCDRYDIRNARLHMLTYIPVLKKIQGHISDMVKAAAEESVNPPAPVPK